MTLVVAAIAPHGGPIFDLPEGATRKAMEELGRRFDAARPEAVIVLTPHGVYVDGHVAVVRSARLEGDASQWTDADTHLATDGDPELAEACISTLRDEGLPAVGVTFGATAAGASTMPLDWGALIPLWFMRAPAVVVTPSRDRSAADQVRAGAALARATGDRRVGLIASADHGHGHAPGGPYGYAPESAPYDERIVDIVRRNRLDELLDLEERFVQAAFADSWWQMLLLHGALGDGWACELLSYEVPTYFGMLCAAFAPRSSS
jgi:aromatic ring-opening dioxygenase LigB subunit